MRKLTPMERLRLFKRAEALLLRAIYLLDEANAAHQKATQRKAA